MYLSGDLNRNIRRSRWLYEQTLLPLHRWRYSTEKYISWITQRNRPRLKLRRLVSFMNVSTSSTVLAFVSEPWSHLESDFLAAAMVYTCIGKNEEKSVIEWFSALMDLSNCITSRDSPTSSKNVIDDLISFEAEPIKVDVKVKIARGCLIHEYCPKLTDIRWARTESFNRKLEFDYQNTCNNYLTKSLWAIITHCPSQAS